MNVHAPFETAARSGVPGLTGTQVRAQLARTGWTTALPVVAHDAQHDSPGKAPLIGGWTKWALFEGRETTAADLAAWDRRLRDAPGTGIACGPVIVIDIDFKHDPPKGARIRAAAIREFGLTPYVREGESPKVALVYGAAEPIPSFAFKVANGTGDGLDILAEKKQFVAFGIHPVTGQPYRWTGAESPLTAGPDVAPEVTWVQVEAFLARAHEIVPLVGGGTGRAGGGRGGASAEIVRDDFGRVVDGREGHLRNTVFAVACAMQAAGEAITVDALTERAWERFAGSSVLEDGRWSPDAAREKAAALIKKVARGDVTLGTEPKRVDPTYPNTAVPLTNAQAAVAEAVQRYYADAAAWEVRRAEHAAQKKAARAEWRAKRDDWKLDQDALAEGWEPEEGEEAASKPDPFKFPPFDEPPPVFVLPADVGTGKTHAIGVALAGEGAGLPTAIAMPTLQLADQVAERFKDGPGVEGRVIRGRDALNPEAPGALQKMCREPEMVAAAVAIGAPVQKSCCKQKMKDTLGRPVVRRCRHFAVCAYQLQMADAPSILFSAHQMLAYGYDVFKGIRRVIADETFAGALLPDLSRGVSLDEIGAPLNAAEVAALTEYVVRTSPFAGPLLDSAVTAARDGIELRRRVIATALRAQAAAGVFGPVLRPFLTASYGIGFGLTEAICTEAVRDAWRLKPDVRMYPEMPEAERRAAAQAAGVIKHVRARAAVMAHLRDFLGMDGEKSGRVFLEKKETDHGHVVLVRTRGVDAIAKNFQVPTLAIDATPPAEAVFKTFLPQAVRLPRIAVEMPHVRVWQVLDAPISKKKLKIDRNRTAVRRALLDEWIRLGRQPLLVVAQKEFADWLRTDGKLPEGIAVEHYGAIAGLDQYKKVRGIVCVGREQPKPWNVESTAGALTGLYPETVAVPRAGGKSKLPWFNKVQRGIRMANGSGRAVMVDEHPDPLCEAIRRGVCEDQIIQAIGRGRGVLRTAETPLDVLILADVCLDLKVDVVDVWEAPGEEVEMLAEGMVLNSPSDMVKVWPAIWSSEEAAKKWVQRRTEQARAAAANTGTNPYYDLLIGKCPRVRRFRYQHQGRRQKWRVGLYDPAAVPDPRASLEDRLGCHLADFKIDAGAEEANPQPAASATFLPPKPVRASSPAAKTAALTGTLGRWLDLIARTQAAEAHSRAPLSLASPLHS